jgi:hypothetical protein
MDDRKACQELALQLVYRFDLGQVFYQSLQTIFVLLEQQRKEVLPGLRKCLVSFAATLGYLGNGLTLRHRIATLAKKGTDLFFRTGSWSALPSSLDTKPSNALHFVNKARIARQLAALQSLTDHR